MELHTNIFFLIEIIGTIAFASSGAMVAVRKKLDLFGIIVLGVITSVGGGMIRDLMIGSIPPNMFRNPIYVFAAFVTVLIMFLIFRCRPHLLGSHYMESYEKVMNILDAIGLGAFTVLIIDANTRFHRHRNRHRNRCRVRRIPFPYHLPGRYHRDRRRHPAGYHGR